MEVIVDNSKRSHALIMLYVSKIINKLFQAGLPFRDHELIISLDIINILILNLFKYTYSKLVVKTNIENVNTLTATQVLYILPWGPQ